MSLLLSFCEQDLGYYCGPATVQQTLRYINGSSFSLTQKEIANKIGTTSSGSDLNSMVLYVNSASTGYNEYKIVKTQA